MGNINFKKKVNLKAFDELIKEAGKKYSIRVGIIGKKAYEKHEGSNLINAQLGAAHEFGATINIQHPGGQPYIIKENGQALFVKKSSPEGIEAIKAGRVTKPYTVTITLPTRSFLRMPLLSPEGKKAIIKEVLTQKEIGQDGKYTGKSHEISEALSEYTKNFGSKKENNIIWRDAVKKQIGKEIIEMLPDRIGAAALERVQEAFETGGFGKWAPITNYTKEHRKGDSANPPLDDLGDLKDSITVEVNKLNG